MRVAEQEASRAGISLPEWLNRARDYFSQGEASAEQDSISGADGLNRDLILSRIDDLSQRLDLLTRGEAHSSSRLESQSEEADRLAAQQQGIELLTHIGRALDTLHHDERLKTLRAETSEQPAVSTTPDEIDSSAPSVKTLSADLSMIHDRLADVQMALDNAQEANRTSRSEMAKRLIGLQETLESKERDTETLSQDFHAHLPPIASTLSGTAERVHAAQEAMSAQFSELGEKINEIRGAAEENSEKLRERVSERLTGLTRQVEAQTGAFDLKPLQAELSKLMTSSKEAMTAGLADLEKKIEKTSGDAASHASEAREGLTEQLTELTELSKLMTSSKEAMTAGLADLEKKIEKTSGDAASHASEAREGLTEQLTELNAQVRQIGTQTSALDVGPLHAQLSDLRNRIVQHQSDERSELVDERLSEIEKGIRPLIPRLNALQKLVTHGTPSTYERLEHVMAELGTHLQTLRDRFEELSQSQKSIQNKDQASQQALNHKIAGFQKHIESLEGLIHGVMERFDKPLPQDPQLENTVRTQFDVLSSLRNSVSALASHVEKMSGETRSIVDQTSDKIAQHNNALKTDYENAMRKSFHEMHNSLSWMSERNTAQATKNEQAFAHLNDVVHQLSQQLEDERQARAQHAAFQDTLGRPQSAEYRETSAEAPPEDASSPATGEASDGLQAIGTLRKVSANTANPKSALSTNYETKSPPDPSPSKTEESDADRSSPSKKKSAKSKWSMRKASAPSWPFISLLLLLVGIALTAVGYVYLSDDRDPVLETTIAPQSVPTEPQEAIVAPPTPEPEAVETPSSEPEVIELPSGPASEETPVLSFRDVNSRLLSPRLVEGLNAEDTEAQFALGMRYLNSSGPFYDSDQAAYWLEQASQGGLLPATYELALLLEADSDGARSSPRILSLLEQAAQGGNVDAMAHYALKLMEGSFGTPEPQEAVGWFRRAAEYGHVDSQFNLAVLLERGLGIEADSVKALEWYLIAARGGDVEATIQIDRLSETLSPDLVDATKNFAELWVQKTPDAKANQANRPAEGW